MASPSLCFLFLLIFFCSGTQTHKCTLRKHIESCTTRFPVYIFDESTGKCKHNDTLCPGTPNTFPSLRACEKYCTETTRPDLCYLKQSSGVCNDRIKMFYYNANLSTCEQFTYGGCDGNENKFDTLEECKSRCDAWDRTGKDSENSTLPGLCYLRKSSGVCNARMRMFYYNINTGTCELFTYGGCGGNENKFDTLEECKKRCNDSDRTSKDSEKNTSDTKTVNNEKATEVHRTHRTSETTDTAKFGLGQNRNIEQLACLEPPLKGNCSEKINQYFFDPMTRRCKQFIYSGCGGNSNRFSSMKKCEDNCMRHCTDQVEVVDCTNSEDIWEFYYDQETGSCVHFEPGKCGGNNSRNIFHNVRQCELSCVRDTCKLMPFGTPCTNETKYTIYYDHITRTCKKWTDGCLANENSFETIKHCQNKCLPQGLICRLPPDQGRACLTKDEHFYYDAKNRRCQGYRKGKCPTTSNHFMTYRQCSWMCEENACVQEWAPSYECKTTEPRYYLYNLTTRECELSPRGRCSGSNNRFISEKHCQNKCVSGNICTMPVNHGSCHGSEQRWHFHSETGRCRSFSYSGCGGNGNNFLSESMCKKACSSHPCQAPKNMILCKTPANKYYYDSKFGLCVFTNTTCFVHGKMFASFDQCKRECVVDNPCLEAVFEEYCSSTQTRYYYDAKSGKCTSFEYNGCYGNANNYQSLEDCETACNWVKSDTIDTANANEDGTEGELSDSEDVRMIDDESTLFGKKPDRDPKFENDATTSDDSGESVSVFPPRYGHICLLPLNTGSCNQVSERFYFDSKTRTCRQFLYNGCVGNANNFRSMEECNATCVHICQNPIQTGQCATKVTRYHYNRTSGMCEPFPGSVCSNGLNNFINKDTCESICVSDPCLQSKKAGVCNASMKRFYYNSKTDSCISFIYGGCSGNENNFLTLNECQDRCRHLSRCRLSPYTNTCWSAHRKERFYFDNASGTCKPTGRILCFFGSYANLFNSLSECESRCKPTDPCATPGKIDTQCHDFFKFERFYFNETKGVCEKHSMCSAGGFETASQCEARCHVNICTLPSYHGPCDLDQVRYYYSQRSKKCRPFIYGGCYGNKNNFETIEECVSHCDSDRCMQPEQAGSCDQNFKRYYSDTATKSCLPFTYSGCGGNSNNFATFESCQNSCHRQPKCRKSPGQVSECNICELKPENKECEPPSRRRHFYYNSSTGRCLSFNVGVCGDKDGNSFDSFEECEETCGLSVCKVPPLPFTCSDADKRGNFFYDQETDNCKSFGMGICGENLNSFLNLQQCENKCVKNVCHFTKDPGPCRGSIRRIYYNRLSGRCEEFYYGGCGGNKNNFETVDNCKKKCIRDPCKLAPDSGRCNAYLPHYYYNPDDGRCHRFIYSGCGGNENRFQTIEDCLEKCQPNHCNLPPDAGPCEVMHRRFYYNSTIGKCAIFYYGGCKGNNNNFETAESCEETCSSNPCKQPAKVGPCEARIKRFYFNSITGQCEQFYYGGCDANENNFETIEDCERRCSRDPCTLNADPGTCNGNMMHFYYDLEAGRCRQFTYTGCGGNENRFISETHCMEKCIHNRCKKGVDPGSCDGNIARFFYDSKKGECTPFSYGGCGGNSNNFQSEEQCRDACLKENPCFLPKISGPCMGLFRRFYYNPVEGKCAEFDYGGCQGNGNNFESLEECESICALVYEKKHVGKCFLPKDKGRCYSQEQRFYYNFERKTCESFTYTGCDGNANNFLSEGQCERECKIDICKQPKDVGSCSGSEKRWHFHGASQLCKSFSYSGCGGNDNNFRSLESCERWCVKPICRQPMAAGNCDQNLPRYYYNWDHGRCYPFRYTGCNGNDNQFLSMEECQEACTVDPCLQPLSSIGYCYGPVNRYFYNRETGRCQDVYFHGCQANGNNFETAEECNRICQHVQEIDYDRLTDNGRF